MKVLELLLFMCLAALLVAGCADPRTPPPASSEPANTQTIILWEDAVSGGLTLNATFQVGDLLESASLTIAGPPMSILGPSTASPSSAFLSISPIRSRHSLSWTAFLRKCSAAIRQHISF